MRTIILISLLLLLLVFVFSCKKEKNNDPADEGFKEPNGCYTLPRSTSAFSYSIFFDTLFFESPSFNPANADEFVFTMQSSQGYGIYTYNLKQKKAFKIFSGFALKPRWGMGGKIVFKTNSNIFSITSDGNLLNQLTYYQGLQKENMHNWDWNSDGSLIAIQNAGLSLSLSGIVITPSGAVVDSLPGRYDINGFSYGCSPRWGWGEYILAGAGTNSDYGLAYFDRVRDTCIQFHTHKDSVRNILDMCWHPNRKEVYFIKDKIGIFKVDVSTGVETLIKESCLRYYHQTLDISADGTKIITGRYDNRWMARNDILEQRVITIMNIDGSNEEIIEVTR